MNSKLGASLLCAAAAFAIGAAHAALAQTASGGEIQEVIVTARRIAENVQEVPISITVFNQQQLTDRNVTSGADLATYTPSLSIQNLFGSDNASFIIRGFSAQQGTAPTVGVYFDEVVAPRAGIGGSLENAGDGAGPGSFFDLQNVQVVKGPQGTLFGRNTTGGAVLLVPQKPTSEFGGYVEASGGNHDMERTQAVINLPINDSVRLRLGFDQETRDGYLTNLSGIGPSNFDNINYLAGRASLVVDVTNNVENYTVASFSQSANNGAAQQMFVCNSADPIFGQLSCNQLAQFKGNPGYDVESDLPGAQSYVRQWQVINTTTWQASDALTVKNIASYAQYSAIDASGLFGTDWIIPQALSIAIPGIGVVPIPTGAAAGQHLSFTAADSPPGDYTSNQLTYTEELQFQGRSLQDRLKWQTGFYMEGSDPLAQAGTLSPFLVGCSNFAALKCTDLLQSILGEPFGEVQQQLGSITYRDYAGYGQATYAILDRLNLTTGIRYTHDSTVGEATRKLWEFPAPNEPVQYCFAGTNPTNCYESPRDTSSAPTWLVDLDYTPAQNLLTYVKYARGYRTGGVELDAVPGFFTYKPEKVDDYEAGEKFTFNGPISGLLDVDGFYNNFTNQQLAVGLVPTAGTVVGAPTGAISNVGTSHIWGIETEAALTPYTGLTFDISYTYLRAMIVKAAQPAEYPGYTATADYAPGTPLPYTPENKLSLTGSYQLPLDKALGNISLAATYTYNSSEITGIIGPYYVIPSYGLLNLNLNWESIRGGPLDAELFMTNATNKFYDMNISDYTAAGLGFASRSVGEPRMFGGRIRYHFGHRSGI